MSTRSKLAVFIAVCVCGIVGFRLFGKGEVNGSVEVAPLGGTPVSAKNPDAMDPSAIAKAGEAADPEAASGSGVSSMQQVIDIAEEALVSMSTNLEDYTATFVKQESVSGTLSPVSQMQIKIQSRMRNEADDAPMRIYLKFEQPEANKGREVIWAGDMYDGKMAVYEPVMLLNLKTLWLDPTGPLAMRGQRYPIYHIGLVQLVEELIDRGKREIGNPDVTVVLQEDFQYGDRTCQLLTAKRAKPAGGDPADDFSRAEVVFDPNDKLVLAYRSYGWPEEGAADQQPPLLESYEYRDVKINVGLKEEDFDYQNEGYSFP